MKKTAFLFILLLAVSFSAFTLSASAERHTIPYPENYPIVNDGFGADEFNGKLNHSDSKYYVIHDYYSAKSDESLHILSGFDTYQQTTEYTCGAAAALMVLHWFDADEGFDELQISDLADIDTERGASVEGLAGFFEDLDWNVVFHADVDFLFDSIQDAECMFIEQLDAGIPIMVDWVDWVGHWQVVIGLDTCGTENPYDDVLILADPYDVTDHYQDGYYIFPLGRFFDMWYEGPCTQKTDPICSLSSSRSRNKHL